MSWHLSGIEDYGLVVEKQELTTMLLKITGCTEDELLDWSDYDCFDALEAHGLVCISELSGEAALVDDKGRDDWSDSVRYDADTVLYFPPNKYPGFFHKAYEDMRELVAEYKESLGKYFPEDFDYRNHIRHIIGAQYGG